MLGDETVLIISFVNDTRVHFGGKMLTKDNEILCVWGSNSPGNSASLIPWGKVLCKI